MPWEQTASETFVARHDARDAADAERVLAQLEYARERLQQRLDVRIEEFGVVLHGSPAALDAAQPWLPLARRLVAPAARRYVAGWAGERELHVLAPRVLARRASNVEGSLETLMLAPSALLARRAIAAGHPRLPPPFTPGRLARWRSWAWLVEGGAQWLAGPTRPVRPAAGRRPHAGARAPVPPGPGGAGLVGPRRLHEGPRPAFPPSRADALLLGGSVYELLGREEGERACVALARG